MASNKCAGVSGGNVADGAELVLWDCSDATAFLFDIGTGPGDPYSKLVDDLGGEFIKGVGSGKCLAVGGNDHRNGADEVIWPCNGDVAGFKWIAERSPTQDGYYLKSMNMRKCLVIVGASTADGAAIVQYDCKDIPGFLWNFKPKSNVSKLFCSLLSLHILIDCDF